MLPTVDELADMFGFTPDDLALNRAGQFSARQRQQVVYQSVGYLVKGIAFLVLCGVLIASLLPSIHRPWEWIMLAVTILLVAALAIGWGIAAIRVVRPAVHTITGSLSRAGSDMQPRVQVGQVALRMSFRRWKRLPPSFPGKYRVYYGPEMTLLSLEPWGES